jgi:acyl carrier protein
MTVKEIIGKVFQIDPDELDDSSSRETIEGWDSMGHLNLILGLESEFKVNIAIADAMEMISVEKIRAILSRYGIVC